MVGAGLSLKAVLLLVVAVAVWLFQGRINEYLGADLALYLITAVVLYEVAYSMVHVLKGELRAGETTSLEVLEQATWLVVGVALVESGFGVRGLVYALLIGYSLMALGGLYKQPLRVHWPSIPQIRSVADYAKYHSVDIAGTHSG